MDARKFSTPIAVRDIRIKDAFLSAKQNIVREKMLPYQWKVLNDQVPGAVPSHCMENFKIAAGIAKGQFAGYVFQDSDFAKWIEAVGYSLMTHPDPELEKTADDAIDIVTAAAQADGYLNTYYIINGLDKRFTNLRDHHELYCLGHMIEGAVAYYNATGKDKLLKAMERYVDLVDSLFGPEEGKKQGYPGHEVIEMALVRLYEVTGKEKYLKLAQYFIDERGKQPLYFVNEEKENGNRENYWKDSYFQYQYYQSGLPVREQESADGHSVRAVYLYSGMADVARLTGDDSLFDACKRLWKNMVKKRMYITGSIGSSDYGEAFTFDYDLPNDTVYAETCAAIGLVFFARRMAQIEPDGEYGDVMEKALYNGVISGMSLEGTEYFYVNPLEVIPEASEKDQLRRHVLVTRPKWFGCACCPPNLARLLSSIGSYAYSVNNDTVFMHLYLGGSTTINANGEEITIDVDADYPKCGDIKIKITAPKPTAFRYAVRVPGWCKKAAFKLNGKSVTPMIAKGYAYFENTWQNDELTISFEMDVRVVKANPHVREDIGKAAIMRGPLVYCLEEADNGKDLHLAYLCKDADYAVAEEDMLQGVQTITAEGCRLDMSGWSEDALYADDIEAKYNKAQLKWIPYYAWANREPGEMLVWVHQK